MATSTLQRSCRLFAVAWMVLIFVLSDQPSLPTPSLFPGQDKLFHGIVFGVLGLFYLGAMPRPLRGYRLKQVIIATLCVAAYGAADEFHQYFVPGRTTELLDVVADAAGGLVTTLLAWLVTRKKPLPDL